MMDRGHRAGGRRARSAAPADKAAGFAAIDALVALTIFATTIALVLQGADTSHRLAQRAAETQRARALGQYLLASAQRTPGLSTGKADGFLWKVDVVATPVAGLAQVALCKRSIDISAAATGRRYALSTAEICPARPAS